MRAMGRKRKGMVRNDIHRKEASRELLKVHTMLVQHFTRRENETRKVMVGLLLMSL